MVVPGDPVVDLVEVVLGAAAVSAAVVPVDRGERLLRQVEII